MTHWSTRLLAGELKLGDATIARAWRRYGVQPWRRETFKFSTGPQLEAKVRDVVGLYLNPPQNAVVLCVDEKSQIQALDRTAPILPLRPGLPEKATHDYVQHGTTTLFAALEVATGKVTDACYDRHGKAEFPRLPQKSRPRLSAPRATRRRRQLPHPQARRDQRLASQTPPGHAAFHPDLRLMAQPGGSVLRHHHPPSHPARIILQRKGAHHSHRQIHRRLE